MTVRNLLEYSKPCQDALKDSAFGNNLGYVKKITMQIKASGNKNRKQFASVLLFSRAYHYW